MGNLAFRRFRQLIKYGWIDSGKIAPQANKSRWSVFIDIFSCYRKYHLFSNQYTAHQIWSLSGTERDAKAIPIGKENIRRDHWVEENYRNWRFIRKWSSLKWELSPELQRKREKAYSSEFNAGEGLIVQFNVHIHREHYLDGTISIGNNVLLAKNVFIDYSGFLVIQNNVAISDGVVIETHSHTYGGVALKGKGQLKQTHLTIEEGVSIGSKAMILDTCEKIGRHSRIGAGAVVRANVPAYSIVVGNPAKIIGFILTPDEVAANEQKYPENERISLEKYRELYKKYFVKRIKENNQWLRL